MSRRRAHLATCPRKKAHPTYDAALLEARRLTHKLGHPYEAYLCRACHRYHTGRRTAYCFESDPSELFHPQSDPL